MADGELQTYRERLDEVTTELERLQTAIRIHRDTRGDDRCWIDDEDLYKVLPEGYTPPARDSAVELAQCQQFIASRQHPATVYVSPERMIEAVQKENSTYRATLATIAFQGLSICSNLARQALEQYPVEKPKHKP